MSCMCALDATCSDCGEAKEAGEFVLISRSTGRRGRRCTPCDRTRTHNWYHEHGGQRVQRSINLRQRYGITAADYDTLLVDQDGLCALCHSPETTRRNGRPIALAVDHDHETGSVRGLLCRQCNVLVGYYESIVRFGTDRIEAYLGGATQ